MLSSTLSVILVASLTVTRSTAFSLSSVTLSNSYINNNERAATARSSLSDSTVLAPLTAGRHTSMPAAVGTGRRSRAVEPLRMSIAEEAPPAAVGESGTKQPVDIPTTLPSDCGIDYVPLATMLATGDLKGADQFTRDALIKAAGTGSQKRAFVYWTEVKKIPNTDLATMDNLWVKYSKGKFGYSVQRDIWRKTKGDFENFCRRLGWTTTDSEVERKLRWFGANEFIYDVDKAPKGHLPLTSALRGTTLLKELMTHPVWETDWQWK